jgi:hypothetical protein
MWECDYWETFRPPTVRANISQNASAGGTYYTFLACLCMACALSTKGGVGMGTLGFSVPVAEKMLIAEGGFESVKILLGGELCLVVCCDVTSESVEHVGLQ